MKIVVFFFAELAGGEIGRRKSRKPWSNAATEQHQQQSTIAERRTLAAERCTLGKGPDGSRTAAGQQRKRGATIGGHAWWLLGRWDRSQASARFGR